MESSFYYNMGCIIADLLILWLLLPVFLYALVLFFHLCGLALQAIAVILNILSWSCDLFCADSNSNRTSFNGYIPKSRNNQRMRDDNIPVM